MTTSRPLLVVLGVLTLAASTSTTPGAAAEPAALRLKFKPGETLRYEFRQKNEIKLKSEGQASANTTVLTIDLSWKIRSVSPEGTADIVLAVDRARAEIQNGPQTIRYDSRSTGPNEAPEAQALSALYSVAVGKPYRLKIDARGRVIEAKVPAEVAAAVQKSPVAGDADGGSVLSDAGLKNLLSQVIPELPEKPVAQGDTWRTSLELPVTPLRMSLSFRDTLAEVKDGSARIDAAIETTIKPDPGTPSTVHVTKQSGTGTFSLDTRAGRLIASAIKQSIELSVGLKNRQIEQSITIDEQMKLVP